MCAHVLVYQLFCAKSTRTMLKWACNQFVAMMHEFSAICTVFLSLPLSQDLDLDNDDLLADIDTEVSAGIHLYNSAVPVSSCTSHCSFHP